MIEGSVDGDGEVGGDIDTGWTRCWGDNFAFYINHLIASRTNRSQINHRRMSEAIVGNGNLGLTGGESDGADSGIASKLGR